VKKILKIYTAILLLVFAFASCDKVEPIMIKCTQNDLNLTIDSVSWFTTVNINTDVDTFAFVNFYIKGKVKGQKLTYINNGLGIPTEICIDFDQFGNFECTGMVHACNNYYVDLYAPVTSTLCLFVYCDTTQEYREYGSGCWGSGEQKEFDFPSDTLYYFSKQTK